MATLEMIPILIIVVLLINFTFGFFGVVHTGILNSISSRNYAFETFRNRANLTWFNPWSDSGDTIEYSNVGVRIHSTLSDKTPSDSKDFIATSRMVDFFTFGNSPGADIENQTNASVHVNKIQELNESRRNDSIGANPVWIKTSYGICLNAECKPTN